MEQTFSEALAEVSASISEVHKGIVDSMVPLLKEAALSLKGMDRLKLNDWWSVDEKDWANPEVPKYAPTILDADSESERIRKALEKVYYPGSTSMCETFEKLGMDILEEISEGIKEDTMPKKDEKDSPFKKGRATKRQKGGGQFLSIKDGENVVFAPLVGLDEMVSADMHEYWDIRPAIYHPCIGRDCPGCQVGNEPRFKAYLPVLVKDSGEPAVYPFTISVYNQLEELEDDLDEPLTGYVIKISRRGTSLATRYSVLGTGKTVDIADMPIPDFINQLGPTTREAIIELLEENGFVIGVTETTETDETEVETKSEDSDDDWS